MRGKTVIGDDAAQILRRLREAAPAINSGGRTSAKVPHLRQAILDACVPAQPGCRLPPLRDLAAAAGTTVVTIQRAISSLTADGLLVTRERSGIFTPATGHPAGREGSAGAYVSADAGVMSAGGMPQFEFRFATDSGWDFQRAFWERAAAEFSRQLVNFIPRIHYAPDSIDRDRECDLYERPGMSQYWGTPGRHLPLSPLLEGDFEELAPFVRQDEYVVINHRTYQLFVNPQLLQKLGLPEPEYSTFAGQEEYFSRTIRALEAAGYPSPVSITQPVHLIGGAIADQIDALRRGRVDLLDEPCRRVAEFCSGMRYQSENSLRDFLDGRCPLFIGYSVTYWMFQNLSPAFPWRMYPVYKTDDNILLTPMVATVNRATRRPVECLRFIRFLLSEPVQRLFVEQGNLPADLTAGFFPGDEVAQKLLRNSASLGEAPILPDEKENYLLQNILGGELWQAVLRRKSVENCLRSAASFCRNYLV